MFGITAGDVSASHDLLGQFVSIERELFDGLGLVDKERGARAAGEG